MSTKSKHFTTSLKVSVRLKESVKYLCDNIKCGIKSRREIDERPSNRFPFRFLVSWLSLVFKNLNALSSVYLKYFKYTQNLDLEFHHLPVKGRTSSEFYI